MLGMDYNFLYIVIFGIALILYGTIRIMRRLYDKEEALRLKSNSRYVDAAISLMASMYVSMFLSLYLHYAAVVLDTQHSFGNYNPCKRIENPLNGPDFRGQCGDAMSVVDNIIINAYQYEKSNPGEYRRHYEE